MFFPRLLGGISATLCTVACIALPAYADLKLVQTTTITNPQITAALQSMTPQQRAQMKKSGSPFFQAGPQVSTLYTHGKKTRLDFGDLTFLIDPGTKKVMTLNRTLHTYSAQQLRTPRPNSVSGATVKDTHQTKSILGHRAHHYIVATPNVAGMGSQLKADVWTTTDFPRPDLTQAGGGALSPVQALMSAIKGLPLQTVVVIAGSQVGTITANSIAKSISTAPLPASVFVLPKGFKPGPTTTGGSSPLGGGIGQ